MITKNQNLSKKVVTETQKVRVRHAQVEQNDQIPGFVPLVLIPVPTVMTSNIVKRSGAIASVCKKAPVIPRIQLSLYDGQVEVNGKQVKLPIGIPRSMTGRQFKQLNNIYKGNALFVREDSGLLRIHDSDEVQVIPGTSFRHNVVSSPRYGKD